jgi:hypothetical protein
MPTRFDRLSDQVGIQILDSRMVAELVEARRSDKRIPRGLPQGLFIGMKENGKENLI